MDEVAIRFGGELPLGCDPVAADAWELPADVISFCSGRSALAWLIQRRGPFRAAAISAYTCPTVPAFLEATGLNLGLFDHGADAKSVAATLRALPAPALVLLPAFYGMRPWVDPEALASELRAGDLLVVDAAQSAFAALDWRPPKGGAVLSCPRKTLALGDGALLTLDGIAAEEVEAAWSLPPYPEPAAEKQRARALFADGDPAHELEAVGLSHAAEAGYPEAPYAMDPAALTALRRVDRDAYAARRKANFERLQAGLHGKLEVVPGVDADGDAVPFALPVLHDDRAVFLDRLRGRRVFATPLWPGARHDPTRHPVAADLVARLVSLPIDQRYGDAEIDQLARTVEACL